MATEPVSRTLTADELLALGGDGRRELVEGVLHEMPPAGVDHGEVALRIGVLLYEFANEHGGKAFAAETGFILARDPDTVRAPDAAYVTAAHVAEAGSTRGFWPGAPDLAVGVVSANDTFTQVHEKALAWLDAGTRVVLVADPDARRVTRYRSSRDVVVLAGEDPVDCAPVMPSFVPPVERLLGDR